MRTSTRMTLAAGVATMLASAPIGSTMREQTWVFYAWFGVGMITLAHLFGRWARIPAVFLPAVGLLALAVYLTAVFSPRQALFGLVPTADSLHDLREQFRAGFDDVRNLTTPAPATRGLKLLTAAGIGLAALVVDIIAVSMRQPAVSGLALLAMYAVPTAVAFDGVGWAPFALGATGYLVLLFSEGRERLMRWGRPVPYDDQPGREAREWPVRISGRRIGVAALAVAILLPLAIPGFNSNTLAFLTGNGDGEGGNGQRQGGSALSPFARMHDQLSLAEPRDLMEVRTDETEPFYIRQMTLDRVTRDGDWSMSRLTDGEPVSEELPVPPGEVVPSGTPAHSATFEIKTGYRDTTLPFYGLPEALTGLRRSWLYDADRGTVFTRSGNTRGLEYEVTYHNRSYTPDELRSSRQVDTDSDIFRQWGSYPEELPDEVVDIVEERVGEASSPYDRALALYNYFTATGSGFTYSLETVDGDSGNLLLDFLEHKQGFCQQYSSAMAVMLRVAGVPSRVAVGYTIGQQRGDGTWVVSTDDAHAWVEAFFDGMGWVPFDPTPLRDGRAVSLPWTEPPDDPTDGGAAEPSAPGAGPSSVPSNPDALPDELPVVTGSGSGDQGLTSPTALLAALAVLLAVALLLSPMLSRRVVRRRRLRTAGGPDPKWAAHSAWDEVLATAEDWGVPIRSAESPRATAARLSEALASSPPAVAGLRLAALAEERARYAADARVDGDLPTAVRAVRRGLRRLTGRRRRWRAALVPPSVLHLAAERFTRRVGEAISAVDRVGALLRRPVGLLRR